MNWHIKTWKSISQLHQKPYIMLFKRIKVKVPASSMVDKEEDRATSPLID